MNPVYSMKENHSVTASKLKVLVIDERICLLDSLSYAIASDSEIEVVKVSSVQEVGSYTQNQFCGAGINTNARALSTDYPKAADFRGIDLILCCIGANSQESVTQNVITLAGQFSDASIVLVSERLEAWSVNLVDSKDVAGIVPASFSTNQLVHCIKLIHSGVSFMPTHYRNIQAQRDIGTNDQISARLDKKLTPRQREVLQYVSLGKSNKYIAAELSLCESTVKVHVHEVMKRLGATSRTHASYIVNNLYRSDSGFETEAATM